MRYFLFDQRSDINRVGVTTVGAERMYCTNIYSTNYYVIRNYDYKVFLFRVGVEHLDAVKRLRAACGRIESHVLVSAEDERSVLYELDCDKDLDVHVHFDGSVEDVLAA